MRFLIDTALSPAISDELNRSGLDAVHVRRARDEAALDGHLRLATKEEGVVVSSDTDFGTLLASRNRASASVILFRHGSQHRQSDQAKLLKANLPQLTSALDDAASSRSSQSAPASGPSR